MAVGYKTGGRVKGTPNKTTQTVRETILETFELIGGIEAFSQWGIQNPKEFYQLYGKLLPIDANIKGDMSVTVEIIKFSEDTTTE